MQDETVGTQEKLGPFRENQNLREFRGQVILSFLLKVCRRKGERPYKGPHVWGSAARPPGGAKNPNAHCSSGNERSRWHQRGGLKSSSRQKGGKGTDPLPDLQRKKAVATKKKRCLKEMAIRGRRVTQGGLSENAKFLPAGERGKQDNADPAAVHG